MNSIFVAAAVFTVLHMGHGAQDIPSKNLWTEVTRLKELLREQALLIQLQSQVIQEQQSRNADLSDRLDALNATHIADISKVNQALHQVDSRVSDNTENMETNTGKICVLTQRVDNNRRHIMDNNDLIYANQLNISSNTRQIDTNTRDISSNMRDIIANKLLIDANERNISINANNIAANRNGIDGNANAISLNSNQIASNGQGIAANTAAIGALNLLASKRVAFTAFKTVSQGPGAANAVVTFEDIKSNVGDAYNADGTFTAPYSGYYFFQWNPYTDWGNDTIYAWTYAAKNGVRIARAGTLAGPTRPVDNQYVHFLTSQTLVIQLQAGETVDIRLHNDNSMVTARDDASSSFSGYLLYADH